MQPLDLDRHRELGEILKLAWRLLQEHFSVFTTLALIVVTPAVFLVTGIWGGVLADYDAEVQVRVQAVGGLVDTFVVIPLITAMHVVAVQDLARGEQPSVRRSLGAALGVFAALVLVVGLYSAGTLIGLLLLIVPGIWFAVRFYFGPQAAIVDGRRGVDALRRSSELVGGRWWRTFGILVVISLIGGLLALLVGGVLGGLAGLVDSGALVIVGTVLAQSLAYSYSALAGTLLFFDLRARRALPWQGERSADPLGDAPERPETRT
jgi:hypothetical protein